MFDGWNVEILSKLLDFIVSELWPALKGLFVWVL
jgi:hypothetical protein